MSYDGRGYITRVSPPTFSDPYCISNENKIEKCDPNGNCINELKIRPKILINIQTAFNLITTWRIIYNPFLFLFF